MAKNRVSEEALLKALDVLEGNADEEDVEKSEAIPAQMKSTKAANGGLTGQGGAGEKVDELETDADENDPSTSAKSDGDEDVEMEEEEEVAKGDDEEEESSDDDEDSEDEETSKSLRATMEEDDTVSKAIEVSDFLEHFVDQTVESVDGLRKSLTTLRKSQDSFNDDLRQAVVAIGNAVLQITEKLDAISDQPAQPRAAMSKAITASAVQGRQFNEGMPDEGSEVAEFSKSDALDALINLATQGKIHPALVTQYESTNSLPPDVQRLVENTLRKN